MNKQLRCAQKGFLQAPLHGLEALSVLHKLLPHKGIPARGVWEVEEGWAGGDVQRESMPGFLTTTQVLNEAF